MSIITSNNYDNIYKSVLRFILSFLSLFFILYFGTLAMIGLTSPGGFYFEWIDQYLNYIRCLRAVILHAATFIVQLFGYTTRFKSEYTVCILNSKGVTMVYQCIGFGFLSFWAAFIITSTRNWLFKLQWLFIGATIIIISNILRIAALLISNHNQWVLPFSLEHHTLYNIIVYIIIFYMVRIYLKKEDKSQYYHSIKSTK